MFGTITTRMIKMKKKICQVFRENIGDTGKWICGLNLACLIAATDLN